MTRSCCWRVLTGPVRAMSEFPHRPRRVYSDHKRRLTAAGIADTVREGLDSTGAQVHTAQRDSVCTRELRPFPCPVSAGAGKTMKNRRPAGAIQISVVDVGEGPPIPRITETILDGFSEVRWHWIDLGQIHQIKLNRLTSRHLCLRRRGQRQNVGQSMGTYRPTLFFREIRKVNAKSAFESVWFRALCHRPVHHLQRRI